MNRLSQVLWSLVALDSVLVVAVLWISWHDSSSQHDGGREMGLFFFVLLPAGLIAGAALLFHFSAWMPLRWVALCIVIAPGLWLVQSHVEGWRVDRQVQADRRGGGYFDTEPMRQMGADVVQRDLQTLQRIGPTVDVNTPGRDMTLLRLALASADVRVSDGSGLPVVQALLKLGARPEEAMPVACVRSDGALLELLLAAGADPNLGVDGQEPPVFQSISLLQPANFRLLVANGLDLNSGTRGDPLVVQLAIHRRWDLLAVAIERGADMSRTRRDGRHVAGELASQTAEEIAAGRVPPPELLRARELLDGAGARR